MSESFQLTKVEAAQRQLSLAIRMLFAGEDPVAVHTLAGAASIILTDLVERLALEHSWDRMAQEDSNLKPNQYFQIVRKAQNYLKHARDDHADVLVFDPNDTEALIMMAVMNASELVPMSIEAQVFQLWYLSAKYPSECADESPFSEAIALFGDLRETPRAERLRLGAQGLVQASEIGPNSSSSGRAEARRST
jgi:hypothetical protein